MSFRFYVDWNNNASFADSGDEITDCVMAASWKLGMREIYQGVADESTLELTLNNADGRFNPENASGPYYGNILPRRTVKVVWDNGTTQSPMIFAWIDKIRAEHVPAGAQTGKTRA